MMDSATAPAIALDGGTTNTRARLVVAGNVVATARRSVGVRNTVFAAGSDPLIAAVRESIQQVCQAAGGLAPDWIVAAGMLTSEVGLKAVPHVEAPAGIDELARGATLISMPEVADTPILLIPGIRTPPGAGPDGWTQADVMRGEECETLGALRSVNPSVRQVFLWPGSHTKLVEVYPDGRITRSHTTLAGEITEALGRHSLLAASLPASWPEEFDSEALEAGARAVESQGLGRASFLVRIAALTSALDPARRASFFIGAVLADDIAHLARHPILDGSVLVHVGGTQPRRRLYTHWLAKRRAGTVLALDDDVCENASAIGALAVANRYRELGDR